MISAFGVDHGHIYKAHGFRDTVLGAGAVGAVGAGTLMAKPSLAKPLGAFTKTKVVNPAKKIGSAFKTGFKAPKL